MPKLVRYAGAALLLTCTALPAAASDYARTQASEASLKQIATLAEAPKAGLNQAFELASEFGIKFAEPTSQPAAAEVPSTEKPGVSLVSIGLVLSQLALQTGANYHVALRQAQNGTDPQVMMLETGTVTLSQLYDLVSASGNQAAMSRDGSTFTAHLPLAVWTGATLVIDKGETLALDRSSGAFLMSAGLLVGHEGTIAGSGAANPRSAEFEPFVVMALSGAAQFDGTQFADLGFAGHAPMSGVTFVQGGLYAPSQPSFIRNSRFDHTGSLTLIGADTVPVENNVFSKSSGPAIVIDGGKNSVVAHNLIAATAGGHGIKITSQAADTTIADNVIVGNGANGVYADDGAHGLSLQRNLIAGNAKSGINLTSVSCVVVADNALVANDSVGIAITGSADVRLEANALQDNDGAGISIARQTHTSQVALIANRLIGNKTGVTSNIPARLVFDGNDFSGQTPRLLAGELAQYAGRLLDQSAIRDAVLTIDGLELSPGGGFSQTQSKASTSCGAMEGV
jgi:poly(beta-D-mannuronate) C5 epimerase